MATAHDSWCRVHDVIHGEDGCASCAADKPPYYIPTDPACSDPNCSYRPEMDRVQALEEQAAYWKNHAKDIERVRNQLLMEKKELVSRLERLRKF